MKSKNIHDITRLNSPFKKKIRTQFFSRLRNRGFKKFWLRKHFAILKHEDRQKLMEDSHCSHPEYQMVLETVAESLMCRDFERILEKSSPMTRMKINPSFPSDRAPDINGTKDLFPVGPLTIIGGTISGHPSKSNIQDDGSRFTKDRNVVFHETRGTPTVSTTTKKETMGAKSPMEEEQRSRKRKISALPSTDQQNVFDPTKLCRAIHSRYQNYHY